MSLQNFLTMDPHLLLSIVNMKLRDNHESLEDFTRSYDIDLQALCDKLSEAGYHYQASNNQFK
ncbi:Uncharacterised protein [Pragia fontium]|uniref:DUF4250 domain-containing protein n=1 Tax=Pragia fontium TaxID=82985 RepID=UPI000E05D577|nr:DUF4250 domain-containing protein [Pragia fontium]SUB82685.1 Uncharacterised protein [Pragia fontium]